MSIKKESIAVGKFLYVKPSDTNIPVYLLVLKIGRDYVYTKECFALGITGTSAYERKHKQVRWSWDSSRIETASGITCSYVECINREEIPIKHVNTIID
jgi:hypothetical protein